MKILRHTLPTFIIAMTPVIAAADFSPAWLANVATPHYTKNLTIAGDKEVQGKLIKVAKMAYVKPINVVDQKETNDVGIPVYVNTEENAGTVYTVEDTPHRAMINAFNFSDTKCFAGDLAVSIDVTDQKETNDVGIPVYVNTEENAETVYAVEDTPHRAMINAFNFSDTKCFAGDLAVSIDVIDQKESNGRAYVNIEGNANAAYGVLEAQRDGLFGPNIVMNDALDTNLFIQSGWGG